MPITVTAALLDPGSGVSPAVAFQPVVPPPTPIDAPTDWDTRAVDQAVPPTTYAFYPKAHVRQVQWNYDTPDQFTVDIPLDDPGFDEIDPGATPTREIQIWRNGVLLMQGPPTSRRAPFGPRMLTVTCQDPTWYLTHRYIGNANRSNFISNGNFESGSLSPWSKVDPGGLVALTIDGGHVIEGTTSLEMSSIDVDAAPYVVQGLLVAAGAGAVRVFLTAWYYIDTWGGPSPFNAGALLLRVGAVGPHVYNYAPVNAQSDRGVWRRAETFVRVPEFHSELLEVRLYAIAGLIRWGAVTVTTDEHLGWGEGTDEGTVVYDTVNYLQGKGKFASLAPEKTDVQITPVMPTTGVQVQAGVIHRLSDHQKGWDGSPSGTGVLDHYLNSDTGLDWRFEPTGRILRGHYPNIGVDRTADVVFTYRNFPGSPERDAQWGILRLDYGDTVATLANQIVELGGWGGKQFPGDPSREEGQYSNTATYGGTSMELVEAAPQGMPISQLTKRATARGRKLQHAVATPSLVIKEERDPTTGEVLYPLVGILLPGDTIAVDVVEGRLVMAGAWRVVQVTYDSDAEELSVNVNPVFV